jgi:Na+/proline symporter
MTYWTGVYRMLGTPNFAIEKGIGFGLEILFTVVLFVIQWLNNAGLINDSAKN